MKTYEHKHSRHKAQSITSSKPKEHTAKNDVGFIPILSEKGKEIPQKQQQNDDDDDKEKNEKNVIA